MSFSSTNSELFFSKNDPQDIRLGEIFKSYRFDQLSNESKSVIILGYPDDLGIKLNGGRVGASGAPNAIRQVLYKMTPPTELNTKEITYLDFGNLNPSENLAENHERVKQALLNTFHSTRKVITLGGGHDYGYPDAAAFVEQALKSSSVKPLVINFDAHLDVRPTTNGFNSGTPFYRLLSEYSEKINFVEIGIQPQCNSMAHRNWARKKNAFIFDLAKIEQNGLSSLWHETPFKELTQSTPVFISFDIDALTSSEAGGCSQSWVSGLRYQECQRFISQLCKKAQVNGLGIYEVSPPLDIDNRTSKAAALLAYNYIFNEVLS